VFVGAGWPVATAWSCGCCNHGPRRLPMHPFKKKQKNQTKKKGQQSILKT
jgi:hypothetical protein